MSKNRGQSATRRASRFSRQGRDFNNKKGVQLLVIPFVNPKTKLISFTKIKKVLQHLKGKTIVHYQYS